MTENNEPLSEVFRLDQQAAASQDATREQDLYDLNLRTAQASVAQQESMAKRTAHWASLVEALSTAAWTGVAAGMVYLAAQGAQAVIGWFQ